ncbi:YifB family Mg chelatase-like AAA ATPase [Kitasatospora sp. NA04385]|uniref:YifB family Mg chelatase-like AAA ATPase n=1 Tax=Kitasatospora sp. NA04385 TaxID=2742135 RepID=UPI00158FE6E6|nr:YifB family Mg chelatase-like AAA ATPase [Kitasatospora sp. NA04385]QKW21758.1 YifB family Mg chelatase-like AAA ATPase [Kitasatospora sp. NA04385]
MAFARTCSVALVGVDGVVVEVQADLEPGLAAFSLVGLADKALLEARDRVRAAVSNSGEKWPLRKLTVGLTPASVPKSGSGYDLAVACAVLAAAERLDPASIDGLLIIGELGLDGRVRPVRGVLPAVLAAADAGYRQIVVAEQTAAEAKLVPGVSVLGVRSLRQLIAILTDAPVPDEPPDQPTGRPDSSFAGLLLPGLGVRDLTSERAVRPDLADVAGQYEARRALEIAAAGGHHIYLKGPPGAGKTMLAERLPALLPPLTPTEALEVTAIHSVAGLLPPDRPLIDTPPYCAPHHSTTMPAIVGGGTGLPRPGAVSLAHRGVLFLDEAPEFPVRVLDALRQPLESGEVMIARAAGSMRLPARFLLCLAANPCPCGRYSLRGEGCECTPVMVNRYQARLSGPLLDRVDLQVQVTGVTKAELMQQGGRAESTATVAARVLEARARAAARLADTPWRTNAEVPGHELRTRWQLAPGALADAERDLDRGLLTARGLDRVLRVAWTVADLAGRDRPHRSDLQSALTLRTGVQRAARPTDRRNDPLYPYDETDAGTGPDGGF